MPPARCCSGSTRGEASISGSGSAASTRGEAHKARSLLGGETRGVNETRRDTVSSLVELGLISPTITEVVSETVDPSSSHEEKPKPKL